VTAVVICSPVLAAMAPSAAQTNGLSPWLSIQGWKWSLIQTRSKPARSACCADSTILAGLSSSPDRK